MGVVGQWVGGSLVRWEKEEGETNLEACRHALLETLGCLWIGETHVLVLLLEIGPVLHDPRDLLAMRFLKALLGFLCLEYVLFFVG